MASVNRAEQLGFWLKTPGSFLHFLSGWVGVVGREQPHLYQDLPWVGSSSEFSPLVTPSSSGSQRRCPSQGSGKITLGEFLGAELRPLCGSFPSSAPVSLLLPGCRQADEQHHLVENSRQEQVVQSQRDVKSVCWQPLVLGRSLSHSLWQNKLLLIEPIGFLPPTKPCL